MTSSIPQPPGLPLVGNLFDIGAETSIHDLGLIAKKYGPIFQLRLAGREPIFIGSVELLDELCDESRFSKSVNGALKQIRNGVHDGLFTAYPEEENWGIAHRILLPAFGPLAIHEMYDEMYDIVSQMVLKWARQGETVKIPVTDDFTRLTLDSIALCAMGIRFNSFYHEKLHPFVDAMVGFLAESGHRASRVAIQQYFMRAAQSQYDEHIALLQKIATEVVAERRKIPSDKKDLLNAMLRGVDPKTGQALTDDLINNNMITFLIGHETTSGLLSFLFYYLLKSPHAYKSAREEVDRVVGKGVVKAEHMSKLPYLTACLRETLRLSPTAPGFSINPKAGSAERIRVGKGKYEVSKDAIFVVLLPVVHRDPTVYGEDAEDFRPERMLEENFQKLPKNAWKPFGNGMRGCIGRPFAWQEALLATCVLLQHFDFRMDDPKYELVIKQTVTIKPHDFFMHAKLRAGLDPLHIERSMYNDEGGNNAKNQPRPSQDGSNLSANPKRPMKVFFGSNTGTCQALAHSLTSNSHGFAVDVQPLDSVVGNIPKDQPVVLISASFEGEPPDNATNFTNWLRTLVGNELSGVKYAVFGCGHSDWHATFHKIPKEYDATFASRGAQRLTSMGSADAASGQMIGDFEEWKPSLWSAIVQEFGEDKRDGPKPAEFELSVSTESRSSHLQQSVKEGKVLKNIIISSQDMPVERHVEIQLPKGMEYKTGDYLAILPLNPQPTVRRVLQRFDLPWDTVITIKTGRLPGIAEGSRVALIEVLSGYVELSQPATKKNIEIIAKSISNESKSAEILSLASSYDQNILAPRISPLDLLERYPEAKISIGRYLIMLQAMRIRQYSISSSSLASPEKCSITVGVLEAPSLARKETRFLGVASNYMSWLEEGDLVQVSTRPSHQAFHPPADPSNTPILMFCAGTGIAPFRGFVQERAKQIADGKKLAVALLYVGLRREADIPYKEEFQQWQSQGAVEVRYVFSRESEKSGGCKYVQDKLWVDKEQLVEIFEQQARIYVCGSGRLGDGIRDVVKRTYMDKAESRGKPKTEEEAEKWFNSIRNERYAVDVFT